MVEEVRFAGSLTRRHFDPVYNCVKRSSWKIGTGLENEASRSMDNL